MGHLELGPAMFFVLSAFLLYQPFATAHLADRAAQTWRKFMKGRALRVIPAYWVTLAILILLFRANPSNPFSGGIKVDNWKDGLAIFLFAQTYFPKWFFHGITSAYTLNAEVIFYLLVAVYALLVRRWCRGRRLDEKLRRELYALAVVVVGSFAWRAVLEWRYASIRRTCVNDADRRASRARQPSGFRATPTTSRSGWRSRCIASWRLVRGEEPRWLQRIGAAPDLLWLTAFGVFVVYSTWLGAHGLAYVPPGQAELRHLMNGLIVLFLLLPGVFGDMSRGGVRRFLRWRPIAYVGLVSYGVYLWHQGFTDKAMTWTRSTPLHANFLLITGIAVACSVVMATLSWYCFERPINRRRDVPLRKWLQPVSRP